MHDFKAKSIEKKLFSLSSQPSRFTNELKAALPLYKAVPHQIQFKESLGYGESILTNVTKSIRYILKLLHVIPNTQSQYDTTTLEWKLISTTQRFKLILLKITH